MKRTTFDITTGEGKKTVTGWILTPHFAAQKSSRDWKLTHTPTGLGAWPGLFRTRKDCQQLAEFLENALPAGSWNFATGDGFTDKHIEACKAAKSRMTLDSRFQRYEWTTND